MAPAKRELTFLLADPERRLLRAVAARLPTVVTPDHLTAVGVLGAFGVGAAYALSIAIGLAVGLTGGHESKFVGLGYAAMFVPAIAVLVVSVTTGDGLRICWSNFPLKYVPLALLLIPGVLHAAMLPATFAFELQSRDPIGPP